MNVLIFSDTHKNAEDAIEIIRQEPEVNAIIHAGDHFSDSEKIHEAFPQIPMYSVPGNCDISPYNPDELIITLESKKIFITHGHKYHVKFDLTSIKNKAYYENFDLVVFGHTHSSEILYYGKSIIINPGALSGHNKTYAKANITKDEIKVTIENF